ncbi:GTPase Era [Parathalassolituus penaei]|uniref:GTPase Era n=1 Tax=Parathalassolituus penaei TaxID=2997323 RepID=A0A9X3EE84_9GAMM|nr:GTPase Era [Parathalassolituus penaei]MCY0965939.1 GTPase Era [Parathalassolituus penaei]
MSQKTGFVAIVGRPNVGKSTLLNRILGQKLSITSRKPQTTRHQILGIKTEEDIQVIYVDTPGMHLHQEKAINRYMNKAATTAVKDVDLVVMVVDRMRWTEEDDMVLRAISQQRAPVVLVVNKVDFIKEKDELLPYLQEVAGRFNFEQIVPISAKTGNNVERLERLIESYIPESQHFYPEDQITDRSSRFLAAELVREKIMRQLGDELPYAMTVEIEEFVHNGGLIDISALILVERPSQKAIVIGDGGHRIKQIGQEARKDMEVMFDCKVMLKLWVKVKANWSDDERALRSLGYHDLD